MSTTSSCSEYVPEEEGEHVQKVNLLEATCLEFIDKLRVHHKLPRVVNTHVARFLLSDIVQRVHKREAYFHYFHRGDGGGPMCINERKRGALYAYWILKLRPISVDAQDGSRNRDNEIPESMLRIVYELNEHFAAFYLYTQVSEWCRSNGVATFDPWNCLSQPMHRAVEYAFKYRNISIDAMLLISELIAKDDFARQVVDAC
ncbi:MAG: hypothetical protein LBV00_12940 [Propionibacteriaceae bacterium]|jgi:hypothetical protein|nr:hypothetical protein [Propionibacteriaceae bacterium]